jgi:hypothetical protein
MRDLAARGGEVAAAIGSEWGRMRYSKATGGIEEGYGVARDAAIETALTAADEGPRRAASVLKSMKARRPGRPEAGYEARIKGVAVLDAGRHVLKGWLIK